MEVAEEESFLGEVGNLQVVASLLEVGGLLMHWEL